MKKGSGASCLQLNNYYGHIILLGSFPHELGYFIENSLLYFYRGMVDMGHNA